MLHSSSRTPAGVHNGSERHESVANGTNIVSFLHLFDCILSHSANRGLHEPVSPRPGDAAKRAGKGFVRVVSECCLEIVQSLEEETD